MAFRLTDFLSAAEKTMLCLLCFSYDSCCFKAAECPPELFRKNPPVSIRRGSARRGSVRRSVFAEEVSGGEASAGEASAGRKLSGGKLPGKRDLTVRFFSAKKRKRYFCLLYPRREAAVVSSRKMQLGWFCRTEAGHMGVTSPFTAFLTASAFDAPVAIRTIFFAFIMDCMPIVSA